MATITIQEAQAKLGELIQHLVPGDELVITENEKPIAKLTRYLRSSWPSEPGSANKTPIFGTLQGSILSMEHFDDPLEDFEEYM